VIVVDLWEVDEEVLANEINKLPRVLQLLNRTYNLQRRLRHAEVQRAENSSKILKGRLRMLGAQVDGVVAPAIVSTYVPQVLLEFFEDAFERHQVHFDQFVDPDCHLLLLSLSLLFLAQLRLVFIIDFTHVSREVLVDKRKHRGQNLEAPVAGSALDRTAAVTVRKRAACG